MRSRGLAAAAAVAVVSVLAAATVARAQTPSARDRAAARATFAEGERAFDAGRTEEALERFRRAFRLAPHDAVRFNVAVCLERLGRFIEAAQEYDAASVSESLDAPTRDRARQQAARVRLSTGTLVVSGAPAGSDVLVDGERRCALPCRVPVDPGRRTVVLRADGREASREVSVARGSEVPVRLELVAREGGGGAGDGSDGEGGDGDGGGGSDDGEGDGDADAQDRGAWRGPGLLTWIGAGVAVAGTAGVVLFGLQAQSIHDDYQRSPSAELASDGETSRDLANVSLVVGAVGLAAVALDLFVLSRSGGDEAEPTEPSDEVSIHPTPTGVRIRF